MRALLVLNERSRLGIRDGDAVCRTLADLGIECERDPKSPADLDAVIAAGGDGTVISTAALAVARNLPLGIVPLGTFNDLARTLAIPPQIPEACQTILAARTRTIDLGVVNDTYFVNEASIGLTSRIARRQTPDLKQRLGFAGVLSTTIQSIGEAKPFSVRVEFDGRSESFRTVQLTIANNRRFGGIVERADAAVDDGWLDLYSIEVRGWWEAFRVARKIFRKDPSSGEGLRTRRSTRFTVHTRRPHRISADGEAAGVTPATFAIVPGALRVLVP